MNKLPPELENPYDAWLLARTAAVLPALRRRGVTPNGLTTCRLLCGLWSRWCLWRGRIAEFVVWHHVAYAFDCADGQMARAYGLVTRFGDWYDHTSDAVLDVLLLAVVLRRYAGRLPPAAPAAAAAMLALLGLSMGCQQAYYDGPTPETLDWHRGLCRTDDPARWLRWTRLFGAGTWQWFTVALVLALECAGAAAAR